MQLSNLAFTTVLLFVFATNFCPAQQPDVVALQSNPSPQSDFKIITEVFLADSNTPVSRNHTLFQNNNIVCDVRFDIETRHEPIEFTIYDPKNRKFVLLDVPRQIRLELDTLQLLRIIDGMRKELDANEKTQHLAQDEFQEHYDIEKNLITVENQFVAYLAKGIRPEHDSVLQLYHDFLDNFTMLASTNPMSFPPFARIRLNRAIKKYGFVPTEIVRSIKASTQNARENLATTKHELVTSLNDTDVDHITTAKRYWTQFPKVGLAKYRGIVSPGSSESAPKP